MPAFVTMVPPVKGCFQGLSDEQNESNKNDGCHNQRPSAETAGDADACRQPYRRGRCQTVNLFSSRIAQDHTGSQKSNAGNYPLDDAAACSRIAAPWMLADEYDEGGPQRDDSHSADAGRLAPEFAVQTNRAADDCCCGEANDCVGPIDHRADIFMFGIEINAELP